MLDKQQIQEVISPYIEAVKELKQAFNTNQKKKDNWEDEKPLPKFSKNYLEANKLLEMMLVHYDISKIPYKLFEKNAPNEDALQREYRIANYKPVTMPIFHKALTILNRVFNKSNVKILMNDEQREFYKSLPRFGSVFNYFEQIVSPQKIVDPNAVIGIKVFNFPLVETDEGLAIDDSERLSPYPKVYSSKEVIQFIEDKSLVLWSKDKSIVYENDKPVKKGNIFEFWDNENYWEIRQVGKFNEYTFEYILIYRHGLGYLPAQKLKGQPIFDHLEALYQSYYLPAIPNLDSALYLSSNLAIAYVTQMYPQKWRYVSQCKNPDCVNGKVTVADIYDGYEDLKTIKCPDCKGTGAHQGLMSEYQITVPSTRTALDNDNVSQMPTPPFGFVAPDGQVLKYVEERIQYLTDTAFANINIDLTEKPHGQTATEKKIDKDELINFITRYSREIYETMQFVYDTQGEIRWGKDYFEDPVEIIEPISFDIRTEKDLMEELKAMNESNISPAVRSVVQLDFIGKRFNDNELIIKTLPLYEAVDSILGMADTQISLDLANKRIEPYEKIIHDRYGYLVATALMDNPNFLELDIKVQKGVITKLAKELATEQQTLLDTAINGNDSNTNTE